MLLRGTAPEKERVSRIENENIELRSRNQALELVQGNLKARLADTEAARDKYRDLMTRTIQERDEALDRDSRHCACEQEDGELLSECEEHRKTREGREEAQGQVERLKRTIADAELAVERIEGLQGNLAADLEAAAAGRRAADAEVRRLKVANDSLIYQIEQKTERLMAFDKWLESHP